MAYMDSYYVLSLNILKALGGDTSIVYPDADAIWDEINKIYNNAGNRFDIVPLEKNITENGQYDYYPDGDADAFMPVNINVNVPQKYTDEQVFEIESNAIQQGYNQGYVEGEAEGKLTGREEGYTDGYNTGYGTGVTDGGEAQKAKLVDITITENGVYTKDDGYKTVTVEIETGIPEEELQQMLQEAMDEGYQDGYSEGVDDGREEQKQELESVTFRENGTYTREDGWNSVTVEVAGSGGGDSGKPKIYNGFVLNKQSGLPTNPSSNLANFDFSQYDWSSVYDLSYFFGNFSGPNWKNEDFANFDANFNGKMLAAEKIFNTTSSTGILTFIPTFLRSRINQCVDTSYMFDSQTALTDTSEIANWDTSNVVCMDYMFSGCNNLTSVPQFDTSNVLSMNNMFTDCQSLTSVPQFDTSNVRNMGYMFSGCNNLTSVPLFDTSKVTSMSSMFRYCYALTTIPELDFSNITSLGYMFNACSSLKELPNLNIKKVKSFDSAWMATKVEKIGIMDCDSVENAQYILTYSELTTLTDFGGFRNLGKKSNLTNTNSSYFISNIPNLSYDSLLNILNLLYDRASAGYSILTIKLHPNHMALLSDDDKAIAINKGWSLTV